MISRVYDASFDYASSSEFATSVTFNLTLPDTAEYGKITFSLGTKSDEWLDMFLKYGTTPKISIAVAKLEAD